MKSITIHGLDDILSEALKMKAKEEGLSLNKTIKKLLEQAFGIKRHGKDKFRKHFNELCGVWSKEDVKEFKNKTKDFEKINQEDWK